MKTGKVLTVIALTGVLGTGLYAACDGQGQGEGMMQKGMHNSNAMQGKKNMMMQKGMHKRGNKGPLSVLRQLNLSPDQKMQISQIKKDMMSKKITPDVAFTKDGFDKAKFIEIMKQKRENMIESKAEMIDRVYKVLTPKQKEQFVTLVELKKEKMQSMMNRRMNFDQNSYGRR